MYRAIRKVTKKKLKFNHSESINNSKSFRRNARKSVEFLNGKIRQETLKTAYMWKCESIIVPLVKCFSSMFSTCVKVQVRCVCLHMRWPQTGSFYALASWCWQSITVATAPMKSEEQVTRGRQHAYFIHSWCGANSSPLGVQSCAQWPMH